MQTRMATDYIPEFGKSIRDEYTTGAYLWREKQLKEAYERQAAEARMQERAARRYDGVYDRRSMRRLAGFMGGYAMHTLGEPLSKSDSPWVAGLGTGLVAGGEALQQGSMAAWALKGVGASSGAAGVAGAVVGLVGAFMSLQQQLDKTKESIEKTGKALQDNWGALERQTAQSMMQWRADVVQEPMVRRLMKGYGTLDEARSQQKYWEDEAERLRAGMESPQDAQRAALNRAARRKRAVDQAIETGVQPWMRSEFGEFMFEKVAGTLGVEGRRQEAYNKIDEEAQKEIKEANERFRATRSQLADAQRLAGEYQAAADKMEAGADQRRERANQRARERLGLIDANRGSVRQFWDERALNETQRLALGITGGGKSPARAFDELAAELDRLRTERASARRGAFAAARDIALNGS